MYVCIRVPLKMHPLVDVDECVNIRCGGEASQCINDVNKFRCDCAAGWKGGGINATCTGLNK